MTGTCAVTAAEPPAFRHLPVMAAEIVALFAAVPPGWVLDATVGGGGHSELLLAGVPAPQGARPGS